MLDPHTAINVALTGIEMLPHIKKLGFIKETFVSLLPKHHILLLGSSGTGKTQLIRSLAEIIPSSIDRLDRTNRSKSHIFNINGRYFHIIDTPGQDLSESDRVRTIQNSLRKVEGIIHVVCYGYYEGSYFSHTQALVDEKSPNSEFLKRNRKEEINSLIELSKYFNPYSKPTWIITVISKADLWWDNVQEVINYYHSGEYSKIFSTNLNNLQRGCVTYCSVMHKYYNMLKLSGNFDDNEKIKCKKHFISVLLEMALARKKKRKN